MMVAKKNHTGIFPKSNCNAHVPQNFNLDIKTIVYSYIAIA